MPSPLKRLFPALAALLVFGVAQSGAVVPVFTWTGNGGDNYWDDEDNWSGGVLPMNDGSEVYSFGPSRRMHIDYYSWYVQGLTFSGQFPGYYLHGNYDSLHIGSGGITYSPTNSNFTTIDDNVHLNGSQTWNITNGTLALQGWIQAEANLTKTGAGTLALFNEEYDGYYGWSGSLFLNEGRLVIVAGDYYNGEGYEYHSQSMSGATLVFGAPPSDTALTPKLIASGYGYYDDEIEFYNPVVANGLISIHSDGGLYLGGGLTLNANTSIKVTGGPLIIGGGIVESGGSRSLALDSFNLVVIESTEGANTYTGGTQVNEGGIVFVGVDAIPATGSLVATNNGYIGLLDGPEPAEGAASGFLDRFNKGATTGTIGFDSELEEPTNNFGDPLDMTGFASTARLGSATHAILSGTITPQGLNYRFGNGGGRLGIASNLTGSLGVVVDSLPATSLVLRLSGINDYTGSTSVLNSAVVFTQSGLPGSTSFTMNSGGYIGSEIASLSPADWLARFPTNTAGFIGFDNSPTALSPRVISDPVNLSSFTGGVYLSTTTKLFEGETEGPSVILSGTLTPGAGGVHRFAGYQGGALGVMSTLSGTNSVVIGHPDVPATMGNPLTETFSAVGLIGDNSYSGGTTLYAGLLGIGQTNGTIGTNPTTALGTGTLTVSPVNFTMDFDENGVGQSVSPAMMAIEGGNMIIPNAINLQSGVNLELLMENPLTLSGVISGPGGLYVSEGGSLLTLSGNNTFGSPTTLSGLYISSGSSVQLNHANATGAGMLQFGISGGTATFGAGVTNPTVNGLFSNTYATIYTAAPNAVLTINQQQDSFFRGQFRSGDAGDAVQIVKTGASVLRLDDGGMYFHHGVANTSLPGNPEVGLIVNRGALVISGDFYIEDSTPTIWVQGNATPSLAGRLVLDGVNIYNPIVLGQNARIAGNGYFGGEVAIGSGAILSPGGVGGFFGNLGFSSLTLAPGGVYIYDIGSVNPEGSDSVDVYGLQTLTVDATIESPFIIRLFSIANGSQGILTGFNANQAYTWTLFSSDHTVGFDPLKFSLDLTGFQTDMPNPSFALLQVGNDVQLQMIPEPSTYALMGVGGLLLFARLRRRRA